MTPNPNIPPYSPEPGPGISARTAVFVLATSVVLLLGLAALLFLAVYG